MLILGFFGLGQKLLLELSSTIAFAILRNTLFKLLVFLGKEIVFGGWGEFIGGNLGVQLVDSVLAQWVGG